MKFEINTDRLILKVLTSSDADMVLDFYNRNSSVFEKYEPLLGDDFYTLNHQKNILDYEYKNILKLNIVRFWIFEKDNPSKIIGTVSYRNIVRPIYSSCTVGYKIDSDYVNKGYCTEALKSSMDIIVNELGIHRIEALVQPDNYPSIHVLEKLGFEKEGLLRDKIMLQDVRKDHFMYAYLADN